MKRLIAIAGTVILISSMTLQFTENYLIGSWKILKVIDSSGYEMDSTIFLHETFTYKADHTVIHFNPNYPDEQDQTGKWEVKNDTLFQFNVGEKKVPFKILVLTENELIVEQKMLEMTTRIFYKKIESNTGTGPK